MKIFGSEVHDTALVFIMCILAQCAIGGFIYGEVPDKIFSKLIMYFASVFTFIYWMATYSSKHFKNNDNENA